MRIFKNVLLGVLAILLCLVVYTWLHYSPAGLDYPAQEVADIELPHRLRNASEHDAARSRNGGNPYILEIDTENAGSLLYYGASHISDPSHPQTADITTHWQAFKPTVALYESRNGFFYGDLIEPFAGLPEPALVHKLARRDDVKLYTLEPTYATEVNTLLQAYSPEQVALYFTLRVYRADSGGEADESLALHLLEKRTDVEGLRGEVNTIADLDRIWQRDFPNELDWRVHRGEPGYMADISTRSREIRGEHMARILIDLTQKGERVFAVVGSGHVIRQEWNLRTVFDQAPAWDQPALSLAEAN